jgi:8-oxo-dGTP diphosphatase
MPKVELTNMVMVQDKITGKVLVQERIKSWKSLSSLVGMLMKVKAL